jgi:hypothetical protein
MRSFSSSSVSASSSGNGSVFAVVTNGQLVFSSVQGNSQLVVNGEPVSGGGPLPRDFGRVTVEPFDFTVVVPSITSLLGSRGLSQDLIDTWF